SAMAWEQMTAWRGSLGASLDESVVDTKSSPNDLVTLADAQIESLVRGFLAEVRPNDLTVGEQGAAALDPVEFFPAEFLSALSCFDQQARRAERAGLAPRVARRPDRRDCQLCPRHRTPCLLRRCLPARAGRFA